MGQYWRIINIDSRDSPNFDGAKLGEFLFLPGATRLVWIFAMPRKPKPYQRLEKRGHSKDTRDLGALNLPFDLLKLIFEHIELAAVGDAVSLALCNSYLREIGQTRVYEMMVAEHCPWHLQRLICVGDYLQGDDLPPNILKEDEKEELEGNYDDGDACLYCAGKYLLDDEYARRVWTDKTNEERLRELPPPERLEMESMTKPDFSWDGKPETEWILCNATLAEYVRASGVAKLTGSRCNGPWTNDRLSLGHVLLSQICWSSDPSASLRYKGPITRGRWAGHRFAITTVDQLTENVQYAAEKDWTDVTEKITQEVLEIWRADAPGLLAKGLQPKAGKGTQRK